LGIHPYDNKGEWVPLKVRWKNRLRALVMITPFLLLVDIFNVID